MAMMAERLPMRRQPRRIQRRRRSFERPVVAVAAAAALAFIMLSVAPTTLTMNGVSAFKPEFTDEDFLYHTPDAAGIIHDYEPQENVTKPDFLYGLKQGPRVVEFYAPWCPHCRHFRKHYIGFARQINDILDEYYGTTTTLPANSNSSSSSIVINNTTKRKSTIRASPNLQSNQSQALSARQRQMQQQRPHVTFYAVSCTVNQKVCHQQGVHSFPKIKLYAANVTGNATAQVVYYKLHPFDVLSALEITVDAQSTSIFKKKSSLSNEEDSKKAVQKGSGAGTGDDMHRSIHHRTKQQVFDDAHLSFLFNLRNSVFSSDDQPLTNATKTALRNWLELVQITTPVVWSMRTAIAAILADFDAVTLKEEALLSLLDKYPAPVHRWSTSCTKGEAGMGYTCGLWQLFHIMSVGLVEYNLVIPASDDEVLAEVAIPTLVAAETLRSFVEHFLLCDECRKHFLQEYDSCALDRCNRLTKTEREYKQWIRFPVWLYETHNAVNARLLRERAAREHLSVTHVDEVNSLWPSRQACPKCWLADNNGGWDEENVYKYLRAEYWTEDSVSVEYRIDVGADLVTAALSGSTTGVWPTPLTLQVWILCLVATLGVLIWYAKRTKFIKLGLHKKCDDNC